MQKFSLFYAVLRGGFPVCSEKNYNKNSKDKGKHMKYKECLYEMFR